MDLQPASPVHKLFLDYIFLNEISSYTEGISGYRLRKTINHMIISQFDKNGYNPPKGLSQSLVYRVFKALKTEELINGTPTTIKNRKQILYRLTSKGEKRLEYLRRIIQNIAPTEIDPGKYAEDLFAGKISPLEFLPKHLPKEELLEMLKTVRSRIERALINVNKKIEELGKELT